MSGRDKAFGAIMCLVAILLGALYFWALFSPGYWSLYAVYTVVSVLVLGVFGIMFWVGYTIATTPSIQEVEKAAKRKR
ncbi:MAG: transcriptional regulator [archaeon]